MLRVTLLLLVVTTLAHGVFDINGDRGRDACAGKRAGWPLGNRQGAGKANRQLWNEQGGIRAAQAGRQIVAGARAIRGAVGRCCCQR